MVERIYRSRLNQRLDEKAAEFMSSLKDDHWILIEDLDGTEAHNIMLCEQGIISRDILQKILRVLERLRQDALLGKVILEEGYEDVHEFIESRVIEEIGYEAGGRIHTARSRNDQVAVDIRMKTRSELNEVSTLLLNLLDTLLVKASEEVDTLFPLYTHTQHAQVGTFAHYLLSLSEALLRDFERIEDCYQRLNYNPLGACAIGGTRFPIDRYRTTDLLGFNGVLENSLDAVSTRDFGLEVLSCLSILMTNLGRLSEDLILWSSSEFNFVNISDQYCSTSSIMPQKKNPCTLELLRGRIGMVLGCLMSLLTLIKGIPSGYNRDLQESKNPLRSSFKIVKDSLEILCGLIGTLSVNKNRVRQVLEEGYITAVDLAEMLSTKYDFSFRQSHQVVAELVKRLISDNIKLKDLKPKHLEDIVSELLNSKIEVDQNLLSSSLNPESSIREKRSVGSPSPKEVKGMMRAKKREVKKCKNKLDHRISQIEESKKKLNRLVTKYLKMT